MAVLSAALLIVSLVLAPQTSRSTSTRRTVSAAEQRRAAEAQRMAELQMSVKELEAEMKALQREIVKNRSDSVSAADLQRLNLLEQREERLEARLENARIRLQNAQARESDIERRLDNIDSERILYGGLNREDSERAVRNNLDREMQRARTELTDAEIAVNRIESELETARAAADALRRKLRMTPEDIAGESEEEIDEERSDEPEIVDAGGPPSDSTRIDPVPPRE